MIARGHGNRRKAKSGSGPDPFVEAARATLCRLGWDPDHDLEIRGPRPPEAVASLGYGHYDGRVRIEREPDLEARLLSVPDLFGSSAPEALPRALEAIAAARVQMAWGSYAICPLSSCDYADILDASAEGLYSAGLAELRIATFCEPVASFFIGSVVAAVNAVDRPHTEVFRAGWVFDRHVSVESDATLSRSGSLYANVQLRLWCEDSDAAARLRRRFAQPFDELEFQTERGVAILLDTFDFAGRSEDGLAARTPDQRELLLDRLKFDWRSWPIKAFQFAEWLGPYLEEKRPEVSGSERDRARSGISTDDSGASGGGSNEPSSPSRRAAERRRQVRVEFRPDCLQRDAEDSVRAHAMLGISTSAFCEYPDPRVRPSRALLAGGMGRGPGVPPRPIDLRELDALYAKRVSSVDLETQRNTRKGYAFAVAHIGRELEEGVPNLGEIDWGATRIAPDGELELFRKILPIHAEVAVSEAPIGFPDLLFCVDSSGSMGWDPFLGLGPYDSLLRAVYSMLDFLEKRGLAWYMRFSVLNFSHATIRTGWLDYDRIDTIKKALFAHQSGGTVFQLEALTNLMRDAEDRFLSVMITDGQIANAREIAVLVGEMVAKGNGFTLIQIGERNRFVELLEEIGVPAHVVSHHRQLEGLCIRWAKEGWG